MSKETLEHLNTQTLIGQTDQRGTAWHYRADLQSEEPNHYPGAIPVEDVHRRLFNWRAVARDVAVRVPGDIETMSHLDDWGRPSRWQVVPDRQAICRDDTGRPMGIFAKSYVPHQYSEWLVDTVANLLDDELSISSAGLLRGGAVAWVEVSVPDSIQTLEGVEFRPNLLATTSFDGSIATTFKRTITLTVCDNTRELALAEESPQYKVKHSRNSAARLAEAKEALELVHALGDDFAEEVSALCRSAVDRRTWQRFLDAYVPRTSKTGEPLSPRALTLADKKRETLDHLYREDYRVAPWTGTSYGVIQAVNTYEHHEGVVRGTTRSDRNMLRALSGDFGRMDREALKVLTSVS